LGKERCDEKKTGIEKLGIKNRESKLEMRRWDSSPIDN
jgi:hypothetical protein